MKKLFVLTDVHGHFTEMRAALDASGFDRENDEHIFLCLGDLFDRGNENKKVYNYVSTLPRKILIKGNHEERLEEIINGEDMNFFDAINGTDITMKEFFHISSIADSEKVHNSRMAEELSEFLATFKDYYETEHYVFVHAWIPIYVEDRKPYFLPEWRTADAQAWKDARWQDWVALYDKESAKLPNKIIVCGHHPARCGAYFDHTRDPYDNGAFFGDGMINLDAQTYRSKQVNVIVIPENEW